MKKLIVAFSLLLATGFVANNVYAATTTVKSEVVKKEKEKKKKKKKKGAACEAKEGEAKSCSGASGTTTKSCCQSKK